MRIPIIICVATLIAVVAAASSSSSTKKPESTKITNTPVVTKTTKTSDKKLKDSRGKRNLGGFGNFARSWAPPRAERRISWNSNAEPASYYQQTYHHTNGDYNGYDTVNNNHLPQPQYLEAPEPIIEIIIKESNETIPPPEIQTYTSPKSGKKEQVQVFYVKYNKDEHSGALNFEEPVAALSPEGLHQEHEDEYHETREEPLIVTLPPPVRSTTLRAIIRPDSEQQHSSKGIRISFGNENGGYSGKSAKSISSVQTTLNGHSTYLNVEHRGYENKEESALQPVIAHPNAQFQQTSNKQQFGFNQKFENYRQPQSARNFNGFPPGPPPPPAHQSQNSFRVVNGFNQQSQQQQQQFNQPQIPNQLQLPHQHTPSKPFNNIASPPQPQFGPPPPNNNNNNNNYRPQFNPHASQAASLNQFNNFGNQRPQFNQQPQNFPPLPTPQQQHQRPQQQPTPSAIRFPSNSLPSPPPPPPNYQVRPQQPKPIPIPIHSVNQQPPLRRPPPQFNQQQQHPAPPPPQARPVSPPPPPQFQFKPQPQFQQPFNNFHQFNNNQPPPPPPPPSNQFFQPKPSQQQPNQNNIPFGPLPIPQPSQPPRYNHQAQSIQSQQPTIIQGGLVQQAAPNLAPQPNQQFQSQHQHTQSHHQQTHNFQTAQQQLSDLQLGGELVASLPKYEQHITETINYPPQPEIVQQQFQQQQQREQQQYNQREQQREQQQREQQHQQHQGGQIAQTQLIHYHHSSSDSNQQQQVPNSKNIGPLANSIGHLDVPINQQSTVTVRPLTVSNQQEFHKKIQQQFQQYQNNDGPEVILNSQPVQQQVKQGQSVSTIYSEVFPELEKKQQQYYNNQQQQQKQQPPNRGGSFADLYGRNNGKNTLLSSGVSNTYSASTTTSRPVQTTTRPSATSSPSTTATPTTVKPKSKAVFDLPDEVPDDLRQQLLSSGILDNADISILDYDKLGDTSLDNLPAEHLANFFSAGGGAQLAGTNKVETVVKPNGETVSVVTGISELAKTKRFNAEEAVHKSIDVGANYDSSEKKTLSKKQNVDLKVVRFDANSRKSISDRYIKEDSKILPSVDINDNIYNRYLPLKINGAQFPIPDVQELKGRKITSVVVLAPVDGPATKEESDEDSRVERDVLNSKHVTFVAGDSLKQLIKKPSADNYKKWLEREGKTELDLQSVVLLVTSNPEEEQEIFMYDIQTKSVSRLSGELSSTFVKVAEENATTDDLDMTKVIDVSAIERMMNDAAQQETTTTQDDIETTTDTIESESDADTAASERFEIFVKENGDSIDEQPKISISSSYSVIKS